ncbi:MAG: restriction endonuclease [Gammaproteobacteria bacterium]|nr:restriction endonuclease [Gammaproteobacteria bacterium]
MTKRRFTIDAKKTPDLAAMMLATVEALRKLGGSATIQELDQEVIKQEGVTASEQAFTMPGPGNTARVNYFLGWARTYLKRGEALANSARGVWMLTPKGKTITELDQTRAIRVQVLKEERERSQAKRSAAKHAKPDDVESVDDSPEEMGWKSQLLEVLGEIPPDAFERLSGRLLREAGFTKIEVMGKTGDGGIDGVGVLRVNLVSFHVYFQCKRWKASVGAGEIRDFRGALQGRADKGLFITTGSFTSQASEEATRSGAITIDLIDGDRLCDLLKENELGVETIEQVQIQRDWFETV